MRILNVVMSLDPRDGGTSERTLQMSRHLQEAGADVRLLTTDKRYNEVNLGSFDEARVTALPLLNERYYVPRVRYALVHRLVVQADVIHLMGHWTCINAAIAVLALRLRKPYVLCPAGMLRVTGASKRKRAYDVLIGRRMVRQAARIIVITPREIEDLEAYGVKTDRVAVLPNAVDVEEYVDQNDEEFRMRFRLSNRPIILFLGRLHLNKGADLLLDAFLSAEGAVREHDLVFAGPDAGQLGDLKRRVSEAGAESRVHFLGHVAGRDKSLALHAASLLVVPSRREAMSIVALEAGSVGTPVLLTDACGFDEVETFGGGKVVPATVEGIRSGLAYLLEHPALLEEMGARIRAICLTRYSWRSQARQLVALYEEILVERARRKVPV